MPLTEYFSISDNMHIMLMDVHLFGETDQFSLTIVLNFEQSYSMKIFHLITVMGSYDGRTKTFEMFSFTHIIEFNDYKKLVCRFTIYYMYVIYMRSREINYTQNSHMFLFACKTNITKHTLHKDKACTILS